MHYQQNYTLIEIKVKRVIPNPGKIYIVDAKKERICESIKNVCH